MPAIAPFTPPRMPPMMAPTLAPAPMRSASSFRPPLSSAWVTVARTSRLRPFTVRRENSSRMLPLRSSRVAFSTAVTWPTSSEPAGTSRSLPR
jgi:hypothetical protein